MTRGIVLIFVLAAIAGSIYYLNSTSAPIVPSRGRSEAVREIAAPETEEVPPLSGGTSLSPASTTRGTLPRAERIAEKEKTFGRAKEIVSPAGFINTKNVTLAGLVGKKVILVDFWTYSCINCQRGIPYVNAWYKKYKDAGLEIVGVHTPEFEFEKKYENVATAVKNFGIEYPVVLDNDYGTWLAYKNRYWPREYLIDIDGFIVHDHIGEGGYDETEKEIQQALAERANVLGIDQKSSKGTVHLNGGNNFGPGGPRSPETYFGSARNEYLGNGVAGTNGVQQLTEPGSIQKNKLYLAGSWDFSDERAENKNAGAKIVFKYEAKDVYFVAGAANPTKIKILKDGKPLGTDRGDDVVVENGATSVTVQAERLYKLIHGADWSEHTIEMIVESPGVQAFTFTFE